jgi:hypothetical protein
MATATTIPPTMTHQGAFDQSAQLDLLSTVVLASPNANINLMNELCQSPIVAFAGGGQTSATQITGQTAEVTTAANPGDSVKLPPSAPGLEILLINHGANAVQVYGFGTDTIDGVATATGVSQMTFSLVIYSCPVLGQWYSEGLATGFGGPGLQTMSYQDNLTAKSGGGQQAPTVAPIINRMLNRITTVAVAGDSITLPLSVAGLEVTVTNAAAVNSMNIFPAVGDAINALGANAAFALTVTKTVTFICYTAGQWHTLPLVP